MQSILATLTRPNVRRALAALLILCPFVGASAEGGESSTGIFFDSKAVAAAFSEAAAHPFIRQMMGQHPVLVSAGLRKVPGAVELHKNSIDVVYVLEGSAVFVTGGEVVDAKDTGSTEITGSAIKGGDSRKLVKGDMIVLPQGTPHQWTSVETPIRYLVVQFD